MPLTAIILAGGKSSRMGKDKGLMLLNKRPMIQHVIDVAKEFTNEIIIIANKDEYKVFGYPVHYDLLADKGPLAGIYTGLHYSKTNKNIVLSCDAPFISKQLIQLLIDKSDNFDVTIPKKNKKIYPLIGVYNSSCKKVVKTVVEKDQLKVRKALEKVNLKVIDGSQFSDKIFSNMNSKNDLALIR